MQKTCSNPWCKQSFDVTDADLAFYDKISPVFGGKKYAIPPPTRCPECRQQRRLAYINDRHLYRRTSSKSGKDIISSVSPDKPYVVYDPKEWWADDWDALSYGAAFRFDIPFFEQLELLRTAVPIISLMVDGNENSEYVQYSGWDKNCYLCYCCDYSEDCLYVHSVYHSKNVIDSYFVYDSELCYNCVNCRNCYRDSYTQNCTNCSESAFLFDCINCKQCFGSVGLRNREFVFFNQQLSKEEYRETMKEFVSLSHAKIAAVREKMNPQLLALPRKPINGLGNENVHGDYLTNCKDSELCFDCVDLQDCKNCNAVQGARDCHDISHWGRPAELCYDSWGIGEGALQVIFSACCWQSCSNLLYCEHCIGCQDCFGCVGIRHKRYCVLNMQYTKEEYEKLMAQILEYLRNTDEWGEFCPLRLSPYTYNESMANDYFPLSKDQALSRNFRWSDYEPPLPKADRYIQALTLPDDIDAVTDDILNWAIECEVTKKPFKIIKQELDFYRKMKLPIPRRHPDQRHKDRMALRNPRKLWNRTCAKCQKTISTSYAPERPEIVYCEDCYLKSIY